jgi:hypothetical protein
MRFGVFHLLWAMPLSDMPFELANFIKLWRRVARDQDTLAREGLRFVRGLFA